MELGSNPAGHSGSDNWVAVGEIRSDVKHLIGHSKAQSDSIKELRNEIKDDMKSMNKRISELEKKQWRWAGSLSVIVLVFPLILTAVSTLLYGQGSK